MTTTTLPDSDLHAMFTLLEDARRDEPGDVVPWALLEGLGRLIRADSVQLCELDWVHECLVQKQDIDEGERGAITTVTKDDETASYFRVSRNFLACTDPAWSDPGWRATRFSDFYTDLELRTTEAYSTSTATAMCARAWVCGCPAHPAAPAGLCSCAQPPTTSPTGTSWS